MPDLSIDPVEFPDDKNASESTENGIKTVQKTSVLKFGTFSHAGVYVYNVKEKANTTTANTGETYTYSQAEYRVDAYVANDTNDSGLYIAAIVVYTKSTDSQTGNTTENKIGVNKVGEDGIGNNFLFVNKYTKKALDGDGKGLQVKVNTTGNMADRTKTFPVTITITPTAFEDNDRTYKANILDASGNVINTVSFTGKDGQSFNLKHGDTVSIEDILVGSSFEVSESNEDKNYEDAVIEPSEGVVKRTPNYSDGGTFTSSGKDITITYNYSRDIPEGIIINNIPYILMIICAAAGLVLVMLSGKRREQ
jgi:hypothetical protein